jgi:hemerythrin-like domain-containing protein
MENEIYKLRKEHVNFKKLLNLLDEQLDILEKGGNPDYPLMLDILYYMTQYVDLVHHPKEEAIFALLAARDPGAKKNVAELTKQHHTIEKSGISFYEKLDSIISEACGIIKLAKIEAPGRLYSSSLRTHMDKEEKGLFVLAGQLLNDNDWKGIKSEVQTKTDPIFGQAIEARFHRVCEQLSKEVSGKQAVSQGGLSG